MPLFVTRKDLKLYPSAVTELVQPVDLSFVETWDDCVKHCMGADASGFAGGIVNGKLITNGDVATLNAWAQGPP